jgi:hypothetical protein
MNEEVVAVSAAVRGKREQRRNVDRWAVTSLVAVVLITRGALLSNAAGEADTGLFLEGVWRWMKYGPRAGEIYGKNLSAGYYGLMVALVRMLHLHTELSRLPLLMNLVSLGAALATASLLYFIGRRLLAPAPSFCASLVLLLAPSLWWLGIEPHPQGPAIALFLLALWLYLKAWRLPVTEGGERLRLKGDPDWRWALGMVLALAGALLLRADQVLLLGAFPSLLWAAALWPSWRQAMIGADSARRLRPMLITVALVALAGVLFILTRQWLLQQSFAATQAYSQHETGGYIINGLRQAWRNPLYILRQVLPLFTATGLIATTAAVAAAGWAMRRFGRGWARRWLGLWAVWSGVSYLFWVLVLGNNIRHVTLLALPLLWAALAAASRILTGPKLLAATALVVVLNAACVPPSSNITVYASANVPASLRALRARQAEVRAAAMAMLRATRDADGYAARPACFLGSFTTPFALSDVLLSRPSSRFVMRIGPGWSDVGIGRGATRRWMRFYEMYSEDEYAALRPACGVAFSFEYDGQGTHQRYLGKEWAGVPLGRHFYPGARRAAATVN